MRFVKHLSWLLRALLFLAILGFALMNTDAVRLRFFPGRAWETPMIVVLLLFFAFGAAIGVLSCLSRIFVQRREIQKLRRALRGGGDRKLPPPD
jgi:uncharacterized integral membrane protein